MSFHSQLSVSDGIHIPFSWIVADSTERNTLVVTADDIYKFCFQEDTTTAYILTGITTWTPILASASTVNLNDLADVDTSGVTDGQVISYDSGSGTWLPDTISSNDHTVSDAVTNTLSDAVTLYHNTSGTPTDGFGTSILFKADDDTTPDQSIGEIGWSWNDATTATRRSQIELIGHNNYGSGEIGVLVSPSSTFVKGDVRGKGSVDLQGKRTLSNHIAGGVYSSILGGATNSILNNSSYGVIVGGFNNSIDNSNHAFLANGVSQNITYSNYGMIGTGYKNIIDGTNYCTILNGWENKILGASNYSAILAGKDGYIAGGSDYSVITGGRLNKIVGGSDHSSILNGNGNYIYGASTYSVITSGFQNKINSSNYSNVSGGYQNGIINSFNTNIGGGTRNKSNNSPASVLMGGGDNYINEATFGVIIGGTQNTVMPNSNYSAVFGGKSNTVSGVYYSSVLNGSGVKTTLRSQIASNGGIFTTGGDSQNTIVLSLRHAVTHSDANWYKLYLDGASELIVLQANQSTTFEILIHGTNSGGTKILSYRFVGAVKFYGGTVTILSSTKTVIHEDDVDFDAQLTAGTSSLDIEVSDSTAGGDLIHWTAYYRDTQQIFA